jgi:hypothetical protein
VGRRRERRRRRTVLAAAGAVGIAAGGVIALLLGKPGGGTAATAAGSTPGGARPAMSTSPGTGSAAQGVMAGQSGMAGTSPMISPSQRPSPAMGMAGTIADCTSEQQGNGHQGPTTLAGVLGDAGKCSVPRGILPQQRCQPRTAVAGSQIVVCKLPVPQLAQVSFYTYHSLAALYAAYTNQVAALSGRGFRQDTGSCGNNAVGYAETGWNHQELHPRQYTVAQLAAGEIPQLAAMGRMACFKVGGTSQDIVWTTDVGMMLAVAQGTGSARSVYNWWAEIHHVIIFPGTFMCGMPGRMESVPLGNLIQDPVCPAGAGMPASAGMGMSPARATSSAMQS